jgi:glycosyltransferase involved in cell wall biosynthesis
MARPKVVVLRGHSANPWDLRPWEELSDDYDVEVLVTGSNLYDVNGLRITRVPVRAVRDLLPGGRFGDLAVRFPGDRYLDLARHLRGADIVHSAEVGPWFSGQPARLRRRMGFRLALTVWETLPFRATYRSRRSRRYRARTLAAADVFLPTTERARECLLLEGVAAERMRVHAPGIDTDRFGASSPARVDEHVVLSPGRLVWEKGHQDVLRALAALHRGIVKLPDGRIAQPRALVVGSGPEEGLLRQYAADLGLADAVAFRSGVPYDEMPAVHAGASCMVLASLPIPFWEEQFGMVLAESMAAGTPIVAAASGAIPEVVGAGPGVALVNPGDWMGIARALAFGPLSRAPGERVAHDAERVGRYSSQAAAQRLDAIYTDLLGR